MFLKRWNATIKLTAADKVFAATLEPLIPKRVRPNHFTVLRIFMTPFVLYYLHVGNFDVGVPLFFLAAFTDAVDGALARVRRQITEWGILFDPLADKLLIGSVLFLIVLEHVNFVLGMSLLAVEVFLIIASTYAKWRHNSVRPANGWGKIKMGAEVVGILLLLMALWLDIPLFVDLSNGTLAVALVAALVSILWRIR